METTETKPDTEQTERIAQLKIILITYGDALDIACNINTGEEKQLKLSYYKYPKLRELIREVMKQAAKTDLPETEMDLVALQVECIACGTCCQYFKHVPVDLGEIYNIANFMGIDAEEVKEKYTEPISISWQEEGMCMKKVLDSESGAYQCVFLQKADDTHYICSIHQARPKACQYFRAGSEHCHPRWKLKLQKIRQVVLYEHDLEITISDGKIQKLFYYQTPAVLKAVRELIKELKNIDLKKDREDLEEELSHYTCIRCGSCCIKPTYLSLFEEDIDQLANFLGITREEFIEKYTNFKASWEGGFYYLKKVIDDAERPNWCVFLQKDNELTCTVYPARPQQCRNFLTGSSPICFAKKPRAAKWEQE